MVRCVEGARFSSPFSTARYKSYATKAVKILLSLGHHKTSSQYEAVTKKGTIDVPNNKNKRVE